MEAYPPDNTLLTIDEDHSTGVPYIPTGKSPYYLEFRKTLYRMIQVAQRANDLRVYHDGDLAIGVRAGKCTINDNHVDFAGQSNINLQPSSTTWVYIDDTGNIQNTDAGMPVDRTSFIPLAIVLSSENDIESIIDLRGQTLLQTPSLGALGILATADEMNQLIHGISSDVNAAALNVLLGGPESTVDSLHRHLQIYQDMPGQASFTLVNNSDQPQAGIGVNFVMPQCPAGDCRIQLNTQNGFLQQVSGDVIYNLLGCVDIQYQHEGVLSQSLTSQLLGNVPVSGCVSDVFISCRNNLQSTDPGDRLVAIVKVNGRTMTVQHPAVTVADGMGFVSSAQGQGTPAIVDNTTTSHVQKGDIVTLDVNRIINGQLVDDAKDIIVTTIIRVNNPE